jgi:protein TonB
LLESLIESRPEARSFWRPATFGVAVCLHLCVLGAIAIENHLKEPPDSQLPLQVTFLRFAPAAAESGPGSGSGPWPAASTPAPELVASAAPAAPAPEHGPASPRPEAQAPPISTDIVQPQVTPEAISTALIAQASTAAASGGVEVGVPGGVRGGIPGGVPGGQPLPSGPLWAGGDVSAPVVIHRVQPAYPMKARVARVEGEVKLEAVIRGNGTVGDIRVVQGLRLGCTEAAMEALRRWRFRPGQRNGVPVDVYFMLTVDFILN